MAPNKTAGISCERRPLAQLILQKRKRVLDSVVETMHFYSLGSVSRFYSLSYINTCIYLYLYLSVPGLAMWMTYQISVWMHPLLDLVLLSTSRTR